MSVCTINLDESIEVETRVEVDERGSFESGVIEVLLMNANPASFRSTRAWRTVSSLLLAWKSDGDSERSGHVVIAASSSKSVLRGPIDQEAHQLRSRGSSLAW
jgi:hypothetical protein